LDTGSTLADEGARIGGNMRRLISYFNSLFLGMILGIIFVAIFHAPSSHHQEKDRVSRITKGCEFLEAKNPTPVLLIAGTTMELVHLREAFCAYLANQGCPSSSSVIARSASLVTPAGYHQPCALRK
jgi:hypothetical protein